MQNDLSSYLQGEIIEDYLVIIHKVTLQLSMNKKTNTIFLTFQGVFNIIENCMILSTVMWYFISFYYDIERRNCINLSMGFIWSFCKMWTGEKQVTVNMTGTP